VKKRDLKSGELVKKSNLDIKKNSPPFEENQRTGDGECSKNLYNKTKNEG